MGIVDHEACHLSFLFSSSEWRMFEQFQTVVRNSPGGSYLSLFVFVSSRGPFMPFKILTSVIRTQWNQSDTVSSDGQSPSLCG
jgi:hypothetical protein